MNAKHHPSDATLFAYGGGALSEGLSLVVATHLALCPNCRHTVDEIEVVGGTLLDDLPPTALSDQSFARVLGRLGPQTSKPTAKAPMSHAHTDGLILPEPLRSYVEAPRENRWRALAPGIRHLEVLPRSTDGENVFLLKVAPGTSLARHGHSGSELTVVLEGSFSDELGRFEAGDFAETDDSVNHQPLADTAVDCVCLIAVRGPLRFNGLAGRLMQLFTKI